MALDLCCYLSVEKDIIGKDEHAEAGIEDDKDVLEAGAGEEEASQPVEAQVAGEEDTVTTPGAGPLDPRASPGIRRGDAARHLGLFFRIFLMVSV